MNTNPEDCGSGPCREKNAWKWKSRLCGLLIAASAFSFSTSSQAAVGQQCGAQPVDLIIMGDRTGSVSDAGRVSQENAIIDLIDAIAAASGASPTTRIALGRFGDGSDGGTEAEIVNTFSTAYTVASPTLQGQAANLLNTNSSVGTNLEDVVEVARALYQSSGTNPCVLVITSDGEASEHDTSTEDTAETAIPEPNKLDDGVTPAASTADYDAARDAANDFKARGCRIITIGYDNTGSTADDIAGRQLLSEMATSSNNNTGNGDANAAEISAENADGDNFYIVPNDAALAAVFNSIVQNLLCPDDGLSCSTTVCGANNTCQTTYDNSVCQDDNGCTTNTCAAGNAGPTGCSSTPIPGCKPCSEGCDDLNPCTEDSCGSGGICVNTPKANGTSCSNGLYCDGVEVCSAGQCVDQADPCPAAGPDCGDVCNEAADNCFGDVGQACTDSDGNGCTTAKCALVTDATGTHDVCSQNNPNPQGTCSDGNACTTDSCVGGICTGTPVVCELQGGDPTCGVRSCDATTGACSVLDESGCECNAAKPCADPGPCKSVSCTGGECVVSNLENGTSCDDGLFCTGEADTCQAGVCTGSGDPCTSGVACQGTCVEESDTCQDTVGSSCDDGDGNVCTSGFCQAGAEGGTCVAQNNTNSCDDETNLCSLNNVCQNGSCSAGTPVTCNDQKQCTTDSCDPSDGQCDYAAIPGCECETAADCGPGDQCREAACQQGQCALVNRPSTVECSDGDVCTTDDFCDGEGNCSGDAVNCNDGNACTTDSCNPLNGACSNLANNGPGCDPGTGDDGGDGSDGGEGIPGGPCDDLDLDTICDDVDNCPGIANIDQADFDLDGKGDPCDLFLEGSGNAGVGTCALQQGAVQGSGALWTLMLLMIPLGARSFVRGKSS